MASEQLSETLPTPAPLKKRKGKQTKMLLQDFLRLDEY